VLLGEPVAVAGPAADLRWCLGRVRLKLIGLEVCPLASYGPLTGQHPTGWTGRRLDGGSGPSQTRRLDNVRGNGCGRRVRPSAPTCRYGAPTGWAAPSDTGTTTGPVAPAVIAAALRMSVTEVEEQVSREGREDGSRGDPRIQELGRGQTT
jgi:hypothetical protein